jgi:hypothetical protein
MRIPNPLHWMLAMVLVSVLAACGGDAAADGGEVGGAGGGSAATGPTVRTASVPADPCEWLPAAEAAGVLGPLAGAPTRVRSGSTPTPDPRGNGCLYRLAAQPARGTGAVALSVHLNGSEIIENALGRMREMFAEEMSDGARGAEPVQVPAPTNGWDYEGTVPPMTYLARQGHIGVEVQPLSPEIPREKLAALALRVRDRMPDLPFATPVDPELAALMAAEGQTEPAPVPSGPDPCALLTRDEAEAVLGKLTAPPYRSNGDSPLADPAGKSCSYYTGQHRALVLNPEWSEGKTLFRLAGGAEGLVGSVLPGGVRVDTLRGPWEQVASSRTKGSLYFLKGDRMLEVRYQSSSTDMTGALRIARAAVGRL